ncbi:MAG TPA: helix-turn-helix domain-containing protein [Ktedonobacterales bacterium]|nr:helix-turn-helix domain-containing protein [Ktedonobacterales bacterium]
MEQQERYVSVTEAREMMGVTVSKMTRLLKRGELPTKPSRVDARKKLIKLSDVQKWIEDAKQEEAPKELPPAAA